MSEGRPREWTLADGGGFFYVEGPRPNSEIRDDVPVIEKSGYTTAIEALKRINEDFGTDYADGNVMIANQVLRELGELGE